ncbi:MAG: SBBP repeat-containing protein [Bacteroidetes bacterium]|nr:SBBP repeat-containing protein [Bacteroidota bacterium]
MLAAQIPGYNWHLNFGNSLNDNAESVAVDSSGNVYVTGTINGIVDLDPTSGTYNITSNGGSNDFFVAKYNSEGNIIWGFRRGSSSYDYARKILITNTNDIIIVGEFGGSFDFDPSAGGNTTLNAGTSSDGFIAKYDSSGNFIWAFDLGSQNSYDAVISMDLDSSDNLIVIGLFQGTADFNPDNGTANLTSSNEAVFVAKYNSSGSYLWAFKIESNSHIAGYSISVDPMSNIYITGVFGGSADFDPTSSVNNINSIGGDEIFIAKYTAGSNYVWAYPLGSGGDDVGIDINAKNPGNIYLTGHIDGACDFDLNSGNYIIFTSGVINGFIASYDVNATLQWAFGIGQPTGGSQILATTTDNDGNVFITGWFAGTVDFDPSVNVDTLSTSTPFASGFIAKYNDNGAFQNVISLESSGHVYPFDIIIDTDENIYISGRYNNTCDFDPSANVNLAASNGLEDAFVAKYSTFSTEINEISTMIPFKVFPNPFVSEITLSGIPIESNIKIYTLQGKIIKEIESNIDDVMIDLEHLTSGMYLMQVANNNSSYITKIIKQ